MRKPSAARRKLLSEFPRRVAIAPIAFAWGILSGLFALIFFVNVAVASPDGWTEDNLDGIYRLFMDAEQRLVEGDGADADVEFAESSLRAASSVDCSEHSWVCAEVESMRGMVSYVRGDMENARKHFQQAIERVGANVRYTAFLREKQAHAEWKYGDRLFAIAAINAAADGWRSEFMGCTGLRTYIGFFKSIEDCSRTAREPCSVEELQESLILVRRAQALSRELRKETSWIDPGLVSLWRASAASDRLARRLAESLEVTAGE